MLRKEMLIHCNHVALYLQKQAQTDLFLDTGIALSQKKQNNVGVTMYQLSLLPTNAFLIVFLGST